MSVRYKIFANQSFHLTCIPLRSMQAGELCVRFLGNKSNAEITNTYFTINVAKNMNRSPVAQFTKPSEE